MSRCKQCDQRIEVMAHRGDDFCSQLCRRRNREEQEDEFEREAEES